MKDKGTYITAIFILTISIMIAFLLSSKVTITGKVILENPQASPDSALEALNISEKNIELLKEQNLTVYALEDLLLEAQRYYIGNKFTEIKDLKLKKIAETTPLYEVKEQNFSKVIEITNEINSKKEQALNILDSLTLLNSKIQEEASKGIQTSESEALLKNAESSFLEERYSEAQSYLDQSELKLNQAIGEKTRVLYLLELGKGFIARNWVTLLIILALIIISAPYAYKSIRTKLIKRKLELLNLELKTLENLLKRAQEDCFKTKKITVYTYGIREERYKKRIAELKHTIPVLEYNLNKKRENKPIPRKGILEVKR